MTKRLAWLLPVTLLAAGDAHALERLAPAPAGVDAVAYAGAERVYASGGAVLRIGVDGRPQPVARLRGRAERIAASPTTIAVVDARGRGRRLLAGPPTGPLRVLARCRGRYPEIPTTLVAVVGDTVAEALSCERARGSYNGATRVRLHEAGGVRELAAPAGERFIALAGAPGVLARALQRDDRRGPVRVEVGDPSGAVGYAVPGLPEPIPIAPLAVQSDGTAAFCGADLRLAWASPAAPAAHALTARCGLDVAIAGGQVASRSERDHALRIDGIGGGTRTLAPRAGGLPFAWDGSRLLLGAVGCGEDFVTELTTTPYRGERCRVRIAGVARGRGAVRVTVACSPGCQGDVELRLGRRGPYAFAAFRFRDAGRHVVRVPLRGRAARLVRERRTIPFEVAVSYVNAAEGGLSRPVIGRSGTLRGDA